jgi:ABC-2 type transport system permease protein
VVALLVSLRWKQLRHQLARNPWMIVSLVVSGLIALGLLTALAGGLLALRIAAPDAAVRTLVVVGAGIVLVWWIGSIVVSVDDSLAPERFALLPVTARALLPGLVVAGATTIGGIGTTAALLLLLVGWSVSPLALVSAAVLIPLALATCVLGARVVSGLLAGWLARRRMRDLVITVGVLVVACSGLLINVVIRAFAQLADPAALLPAIADAAGWTPLGAVFGVSASLATGDLAGAGLRLLLALATVAALWFAARGLLAARLVAPIQSRGGGRVRSGGLLDRILPASAVGAIAARTLRYARRDPRQVINTTMMLLLPALLIGMTLMNGRDGGSFTLGPAVILIPAINALIIGTIVQMGIAYDNDAIALHIHTGVPGRADRAGRVLGFGIIAVPVTIVLCVAASMLAGRADLIPASLGAALGLGAAAAGVGTWVGTFLPGRAPAPEANPLGRGSSGGVQSMLAMIIIAPLSLLIGGTAFGLAIAAIWTPWLGWLSLAGAVLFGGLSIWAGTVLGGRILDRRWPEVLAEVSSEA